MLCVSIQSQFQLTENAYRILYIDIVLIILCIQATVVAINMMNIL